MKVALCFLISGEHILNKERIWKDWIKENEDIINVYFHYKDYSKITSEWIKEHVLPISYIVPTSYFHVVPAYMSLLKYALAHDQQNQWTIFLTESCVPIISPQQFKNLFLSYSQYSIINWKRPWWDIKLHKRANLNKLPEHLQLGHDPYFVLKREDSVALIKGLSLSSKMGKLYNLVCKGGLANESVFVILLHFMGRLTGLKEYVLPGSTHATDWSRPTSSTSPHVFTDISDKELDSKFIQDQLESNKYTMFLRKVAPSFPDQILEKQIFSKLYLKKVEQNYEKIWISLKAFGIGIGLFICCHFCKTYLFK
jgi:hypothetical protein